MIDVTRGLVWGRIQAWQSSIETLYVGNGKMNCLLYYESVARPTSDYVPICLHSGEKEQKRRNQFKFEKWWLKHKEAKALITKSWHQPTIARDAAADICINLRRLKKVLKGWNRKFFKSQRESKDDLLQWIGTLERMEEKEQLILQLLEELKRSWE